MSQGEGQPTTQHKDPVACHNPLQDLACPQHDPDKGGPNELLKKWHKAMRSACKAQKLLQDVMNRLDDEIWRHQEMSKKQKKTHKRKGSDMKARHNHHCNSSSSSGSSSGSSNSAGSSSESSDSDSDQPSCRSRHSTHHHHHHHHRRCRSHGRRDCSRSHSHHCSRSHSQGRSRCHSRDHSRSRHCGKCCAGAHHQPGSYSNQDCVQNQAEDAGIGSSICTIEDVHSL